ncbi:MAG: hypothetical protein IPM96_19775 [Ignavibacteria bacterium]|nr:hypothetical protein [Ignavibacteria bacterium]
MFDCVMPTRNARHGRLFTTYGEINLWSSLHKFNSDSPDPEYQDLYIGKLFTGVYLGTFIHLK